MSGFGGSSSAPALEVRTIVARFASQCGACGAQIRKGARIRYARGFAANHEDCGDPCTPLEGSTRSSSHRRYVSSGRGYVRCTHEDYPCCGCGS